MKNKIVDYILTNENIQQTDNIDIFLATSTLRKNILSWYPFKRNANILEINGNFGEITELLCEKNSNVVCIEQDEEKQKCILKRCDYQKNNLKIYDNISNLTKERFDYIVLINGKDEHKLKLLPSMKKILKEDGVILAAFDNIFGIKNLKKENVNKLLLSRNQIEDKLKKAEFKNFKVYNILFDYNIANIIFSDDYMFSREDIERNFAYELENEKKLLDEQNFLKVIYNEDPRNIKNYANSFLFEISNSNNLSEYNAIFFNVYRKEKYQLITAINNEFVEKKSAYKIGKRHINNYIENINDFDIEGVTLLDKGYKDKVISKYIDNYIRYDIELYECQSFEEFIQKFKRYSEKLYLKSYDYDENKINNKLKKYNINLLKKMKYLEKAYVDMIPKNCFKIEEEFNFFDQEWVINDYPVEFILYRAILNATSLQEKFGKEKIFEELGITDYIELLELLEKEFSDEIKNNDVLNNVFYKTIRNNVEENTAKVENEVITNNGSDSIKNRYNEELNILEENLRTQRIENAKLLHEIETLKNSVENRDKQLNIISKSLSWKITKPLRKISYVSRKGLHFINNKPSSIKLNPINYFKYKKVTDLKTAKYWFKLDKKIAKFEKTFVAKNEYEEWLIKNRVNSKEIKNQKKYIFRCRPKISILIPLYNTPINFFRELLYSLEKQTYTNWELCLADGSNKELEEIKKMCSKDNRIIYKFIGENKGISGNTNEALSLATGDYIALFDHDDLLPINSLYEIVKCINENPEVKFIYTDEDKISKIDEPRYAPHFKPDYAPDFFRSNNYICHFSVFRRDIMEQIGGFRDKYNGAQDFDIILRMTEIVEKEKIKHIPKILYHWRVHRDSTASKPEAKPYAYYAGRTAVQDNINRLKLKGTANIEEELLGIYKIKYDLLSIPKVSIFIHNIENNEKLEKCINSILNKTTYTNYEIFVINDNNINLNNLEKKYKFKMINVPFNGKINNTINNLSEEIDSEYFIMLDANSIIYSNDWIESLLRFAQREDVGIVSLLILDLEERIKHAGIYYEVNGFLGYPCRKQEVCYNGYCAREKTIGNMNIVTDECMMIKKSIFKEVNGFDEAYENGAFIDLCFKIREKEYLIVYEPHAIIYSQNVDFQIIDQKVVDKIKKKWKKEFEKGDCYYNKNLIGLNTIYNILWEETN